MFEIIIPVVVVVLISALCYYFLRNQPGVAQIKTEDGKKQTETTKGLDRSKDGLHFSYTGWIRIDDFGYRYGEQKVIFVKGTADTSMACPALIIDANTNSLLLKVDTFGEQETISVVSVPAKKWLHFVISVDQESVDMYINGILYAHHTLVHLPRQNSAQLLTSPSGGFAGKIVSLQYQQKSMTSGDALKLASTQPPTGKETGTQVYPPYFDYSWFKS